MSINIIIFSLFKDCRIKWSFLGKNKNCSSQLKPILVRKALVSVGGRSHPILFLDNDESASLPYSQRSVPLHCSLAATSRLWLGLFVVLVLAGLHPVLG